MSELYMINIVCEVVLLFIFLKILTSDRSGDISSTYHSQWVLLCRLCLLLQRGRPHVLCVLLFGALLLFRLLGQFLMKNQMVRFYKQILTSKLYYNVVASNTGCMPTEGCLSTIWLLKFYKGVSAFKC